MENEEKDINLEDGNNKSPGDEEVKEYQEKDARTTRGVLRIFSAIWEAIVYFFS